MQPSCPPLLSATICIINSITIQRTRRCPRPAHSEPMCYDVEVSPLSTRSNALRPPDPVQVLDLFAQERAALLELLSGLSEEEWERPTACAGWSVKDVALHILGGDLGNLSRRRDGFRTQNSSPGEDLVEFVNRINEEWVQVARRLSPRVLIDLLGFAGPQLFDYFASLDLSAQGGGVSWAGLDPAPVWLDV